MTLLILEGSDLAGKSSLAAQLASYLPDVKVLKRGPLERHVLEEYEVDLDGYRADGEQHIVCDRWHVGELVYGPLLRNESKLLPIFRVHIEKFLQARGALLLHLEPPLEELERRLEARGDDLIRRDQLRRIQMGYDAAYSVPSSLLEPWRATETPEPDDVVRTARLAQSLVRKLAPFRTYIGEHNPSVLLLGDRRRTADTDDTHHAAFIPYAASSGHFLLSSLPSELRRTCGIANACEEDVMALWMALRQPSVVALGRNAETACRFAGVPHAVVPHPQRVRRFSFSMGEEYGKLIESVAGTRRDMLKWPL